jgi:omega-amidase
MKLIGCQVDVVWEDPPANFARVERLLSTAGSLAGGMVVLPEMFSTGFSFNVETVAEPHGGATERFLQQLARTRRAFVIGGKSTRSPDGRARNEALAFSPEGDLICRYAKMQTVTPLGETAHYTPGTAIAGFTADSIRVSPFICYDLRFPEHFRAAARNGPELYVVIASWPVARIHHWVRLLQARAIENQAWVVGVNRTGIDPKYTHTGRSVIIDHHGEIVADAGEHEGIIVEDLDLTALREYREKLPFLADMRVQPKSGA